MAFLPASMAPGPSGPVCEPSPARVGFLLPGGAAGAQAAHWAALTNTPADLSARPSGLAPTSRAAHQSPGIAGPQPHVLLQETATCFPCSS